MPSATPILWVLTLAAFGLFGARVFRYVKVLLAARPEKRWGHPGKRLNLVLVQVLGQRRLLEEPVGAAHFLTFWAFVFYASSFFWNPVRGLGPVAAVAFADPAAW